MKGCIDMDFRVGTQVRLRYTHLYGDWERHKDVIGKLVEDRMGDMVGYSYRWKILWPDGTYSGAPTDNLILAAADNE